MAISLTIIHHEACDLCHKIGYQEKRGSIMAISQTSRRNQRNVIFIHVGCLRTAISKASKDWEIADKCAVIRARAAAERKRKNVS